MERKFKTATGEPIKHFREIKRLLTANIVLKKQLLYVAKGTAEMGVKQLKVISWLTVKPERLCFIKSLNYRRLYLERSCGTGKTQYAEEELERYERRGAKITDKGWLQSEDG